MNVQRLLLGFLLTVVAVVGASLAYDALTGRGPKWWIMGMIIMATLVGSVWGEWSRARKARRG